jgi:simple sugar transport system permease protein
MSLELLGSAILTILSLTPLLALSSIGVLITVKSGVFNIGVEGSIALGTMMGVAGMYFGGSIVAGLLLGFISGVITAVIIAYLTVNQGMDQIQTGFGIWFATLGLAGFLYNVTLPPFFRVSTALPSILGLDIVFFLTLAFFAIYYVIIHRTKYGLAVISVGENPGAADVAGINVTKTRWITLIIGCGLMGLAGAWFSTVVMRSFYYGMVAGYGWLAIMTVILAGYKGAWTLVATLFFSFLIGLQTRIQVWGIIDIPREFIIVIPYIAAALLLIISGIRGRKAGTPSALGRPYERE